MKSNNIYQLIIIPVSRIVLIISLTKPTFYIDRIDYDPYANSPFLLFPGWMGLLGGSVESLIWFANPLYFIALVFFSKDNKKSIFLSLIAALIAFSFSMLGDIMTSESGATSMITSFERGFKLLVTSMVILFIGTVLEFEIQKRK